MKITSVSISKLKDTWDDLPVVEADLEDNTHVVLFSFYPGEIDFQPEELVGLTVEEAHALYHKKDLAYLGS